VIAGTIVSQQPNPPLGITQSIVDTTTRSTVILNKRSSRSEGSGRAARSGAFLRRNNRTFGSLPYKAPLPNSLLLDSHIAPSGTPIPPLNSAARGYREIHCALANPLLAFWWTFFLITLPYRRRDRVPCPRLSPQ